MKRHPPAQAGGAEGLTQVMLIGRGLAQCWLLSSSVALVARGRNKLVVAYQEITGKTLDLELGRVVPQGNVRKLLPGFKNTHGSFCAF